MSGWIVASVIGGLFAVLVIVLLVVVSKAVARTAQNAAELMVAMEEVQRQTAVLIDLEAHTAEAARVASDASSVLADLDLRDQEGNGRDVR